MNPKNENIFFTDDAGYTCESLEEGFAEHLEYTLAKSRLTVTALDSYKALAMAIRDRLTRKWLRTQYEYSQKDVKKIYYLSMEFLIGRLLGSFLINMGYYEDCYNIFKELGYSLEEIRELEPDMGLGNGGLGRLAACFLDSMATLELPAYGYGIRYEYGIFKQEILNGYQLERPDNWLRFGNPWEIVRPEHTYRIKFNGHVETYRNAEGRIIYDWKNTEDVLAIAYDTPVPGYMNNTVNTLRLWQARATNEFDFKYFDSGDYLAAVESKNKSENISKVLYPNDNLTIGRVLRLQQEYFFISATLQNIVQYHEKKDPQFIHFPEKIAIQLNDTHPALAIPELMRILVDEKGLDWDHAWDITTRTFAYTNHTVMGEALERWPVRILEKVLPRHLQIIYEINQRFLEQCHQKKIFDVLDIQNLSIVEESMEKRIRMANLSIIGSHHINGVSALHTEILKQSVFHEFYKDNPDRFINITNGITPRRWLKKANPQLAGIISDKIGDDWTLHLGKLRKLENFLDDKDFLELWQETKWINKKHLIRLIGTNPSLGYKNIDPESMFDVQVKRFHEYKRQLLNVLHVITLYNRLKDNPQMDFVPRTIFFGGKAAPAYQMAKLIIKLINSVAKTINTDPDIKHRLKVIFLENYCVSLAEKIIPASDLSEQISTAGFEASGTGNMKFALNGALTIGTLDGANIEILEEVGQDNIFIFGMTASEIKELRLKGYHPEKYYEENQELKRVLDMIRDDYFNPDEKGIFSPIFESLVNFGDTYFLLADYESYVRTQEIASQLFKDKTTWTRKAILNVARMERFSSDRTIMEYAEKIWNVKPVRIPVTCPK